MWEAVVLIPSKDELLKAFEERHGKELQQKFSSSSAAVCGLGGLGSNISVSLARAGIGKLILIDFDKVDVTNLHRQQYKACQVGMNKTDALSQNLKEISPYIELETHTLRITEDNALELLESADVICEAFDSSEAKAMLANIVLQRLPEKFLVSASGMAGLDSGNTIRTRRISKRFYVCGDGVSEVNESSGLFSSRVMLCAAHQAHTVLRILAEQFDE